jgi:hypothetical protein
MRFNVVLPTTVQIAALTQPWECGLAGSDIARVARTAERLVSRAYSSRNTS